MNLEGMLVAARLQLQDLNVKNVLEPHLALAANEGKNELAKIIRQAREDFLTSVTSTQIPAVSRPNPSVITLPDDFAELKDIQVTTPGFESIEFNTLDRSDFRFRSLLRSGGSITLGQESFYYDIVGLNTLVLAPGSDRVLDCDIYYISTVPDMVLPEDEPAGIPSEHHDYIVTWMVCEGMRSTRDDRLASYLEKLQAQEKEIINSINARQVREPEFVKGFMEDEFW